MTHKQIVKLELFYDRYYDRYYGNHELDINNLTGRWKIRQVNGDHTVFIEYLEVTKRWFRKPVKQLVFISEVYLSLTVIEEWTNACYGD